MASNIYKPSKDGVWYLRVQINGKQHRESLRTTSKRGAEKKARARIQELRRMNEQKQRGWLFSEGFMTFFKVLETGATSWSAETIKRYKSSMLQIGRVIGDWCDDTGQDIAELTAAEISTAVVSEFVSRRRAEGTAIGTINRDLTAFRHLMNSIKNAGWIETNPVAAYEKQGMTEVLPDIRLPSDEAIAKLAARAPGTLQFFPRFLDETGGRVTEMARLEWSDVKGIETPVEGNVNVTLRNTKGGKTRVIVLRQEAIDILVQIERSPISNFVFWNNTEHGFYKDASNLFWEYGEETGFNHRLHDLRHKFAIERLIEGWSVYRVQKYLGHVSVTTTERYYFRYLTDEQEARAKADGNAGL